MNKKLNILFIPRWYPNRVDPLNGVFIKRHALAVAMKHRVGVLYINADPGLKDKTYELEFALEDGISTVRVYYNNSLVQIPLLSSLIKFYRYLKACSMGIKIIKEKFGTPDVSHIHVLARTFLPAYFLNAPLVVSEQWSGYLPEDGMYKGLLKKMLTKIAVRKASWVTTVSESLKKAMLAHGLQNIYSVIPNVVDTNMFSPAGNYVKKDQFIFLHVSNLDDRAKNVSGILRAVKKLSEVRNDFEFQIAGDGIDRNKLESLAKQLDIFGKSVFFSGTKKPSEVAEMMKNVHCFVLFSNYETFSVVIIEALASGLPIVSSAAGGVLEQITKEFGRLVKPRDITGLCNAMVSMIDNRGNYDSHKIRNYAVENFSYEAVAEQFDAVYQKIIQK